MPFSISYVAARSIGSRRRDRRPPSRPRSSGPCWVRVQGAVIARVATAAGTFGVDLETEEVAPAEPFEPAPEPPLNLPRVLAAAEAGSTVVAVVDRTTKPPMVVSHDGGLTWRESGRGLPPGRAVAVAEDDPDTMVYAARNRLYVSRDGGVFWTALAVELPEIEAVAVKEC